MPAELARTLTKIAKNSQRRRRRASTTQWSESDPHPLSIEMGINRPAKLFVQGYAYLKLTALLKFALVIGGQ